MRMMLKQRLANQSTKGDENKSKGMELLRCRAPAK